MGPHTIKALERFIARHPIRTGTAICEIGAADVNGTLRKRLERYGRYVAVDIERGPNIDRVVNPTDLLSDQIEARFDLVICCDVLEHTMRPWMVIQGMANLLNPCGKLFCLAPFSWPLHRHPLDCYRFGPDGLSGLAEDAGLKVIEVYLYGGGFSVSPMWLLRKLHALWKNRHLHHTGHVECCLIAQKPCPISEI